MPIHHLALPWCIANPRVSTVILGASRLDQSTDNLKAPVHKARLTPDVLEAIEEVVQNKPEAPQRFRGEANGEGTCHLGRMGGP